MRKISCTSHINSKLNEYSESPLRTYTLDCHQGNRKGTKRKGDKVRNILSARDRRTKEPLDQFFMELERAENNKEAYKIQNYRT